MSLVDFSAMEKEIKEAPEPKVLPKSTEVELRIIRINEGVSEKNSASWFMPTYDVPADPMVIEFNDFFWNLSDRDKLGEKEYARALHKMKMFAACFGIDLSKPFSWDDLEGKTGWAILRVVKDPEYGDKNGISKYLAPR